MVKCGVLFEVRTGFLNNIQMSFVPRSIKSRQRLLTTQLQTLRSHVTVTFSARFSTFCDKRVSIDRDSWHTGGHDTVSKLLRIKCGRFKLIALLVHRLIEH
jgi:hypothetical protein